MGATLRRARQMSADLYIGHQEVGAWVVWRLLQEGYQVGVDLEDWYSRDLPPESRTERPVGLLKRIESDLLRRAVHVSTTSKAMAQAVAECYDAPEPVVLYNAFPWSDREAIDEELCDRDGSNRISLHWVSQTIGPGRGLETLCRALEEVGSPLQVHLRGRCRASYRTQLEQIFPDDKGHALYVHDLVSPENLLDRIAEHDIGLALEQYEPDSRDLTVTNKILHYLLGGLAVVATDTVGQREVAEYAGSAVRLCSAGDVEELTHQLDFLLRSNSCLEEAQDQALKAANYRFCWEEQVSYLLASIREEIQ